MKKKMISILSNCYNEEENVDEFYRQVSEIMKSYENRYNFELIFIDNNSSDRTTDKIKSIITTDKRVRLIANAKNFGQVRSPYHGLLQTRGDASISMATDLQDPPPVIREFIAKWEDGHLIVAGIKSESKESRVIFMIRKLYYNLIAGVSETQQIKNFTGFGLYDRKFLDLLRSLNEPYPYFRGLVAELGYNLAQVHYTQPTRERGKSSNNFFTLYEIAMQGFVNHSKLPLRISSFLGFIVAILSFIIAIGYTIYKLMLWDSFQLGMAPMVIGLFFFAGVQLFFLGVIGEYISAIFTQVKNRPLVIEKERVNFPEDEKHK